MRALADALTGWYRQNCRALPFRETRDPYRIWVSEIMAQQTRITALLPYYERFTARFPSVAALAAADEAEVLKLWEGLGYYSRARNLHRGARLVAETYGGLVPQDLDSLLAIPGVGAYTAGAILSIAFEQPVPAVDGNVLRVYARIANDPEDVAAPALKKRTEGWARALMENQSPGTLTQALMELGALICLPQNPTCLLCPAAAFCAARAAERVEALPVKAPKKPQKAVSRQVFVITDPYGRVLMRRRETALLRGLWEFPESVPEGLSLLSRAPWGHASHLFTHLRWEMEGTRAYAPRQDAPDGWAWVESLSAVTVPTAFRFFTDKLKREGFA